MKTIDEKAAEICARLTCHEVLPDEEAELLVPKPFAAPPPSLLVWIFPALCCAAAYAFYNIFIKSEYNTVSCDLYVRIIDLENQTKPLLINPLYRGLLYDPPHSRRCDSTVCRGTARFGLAGGNALEGRRGKG